MADYHSLLSRAVANLPGASPPETRRAIYDRARKALVTQLRTLKPPLQESDIAREERALNEAIAEVEARFASPDRARKTSERATPVGELQGASCPAASPTATPKPTPANSPAYGTARLRSPSPSPEVPEQSRPPAPPSALPPSAPAVARPAPTTPESKPSAVAAGQPRSTPAKPAETQRERIGEPRVVAAPAVGAKDEKASAAPTANLAKSVRPAQTGAPAVSDAPLVVASRAEDTFELAGAPEVPSDVDRIDSAARQQSERQRPIAPSVGVGNRKTVLWLAVAVVVGVVLAVAIAAIVMREKPQDLAIRPSGELQETTPQAPAKIGERVPSTQTNPASSPAVSSQPQEDRSSDQGAPSAGQGAESQTLSAPPPVSARAAMLVASADNPQKPVVNLGSTVWLTIPPAPGQPATVAVKAEADIPDLKMHATMTLRKNTDPTLQATHTIDLKFSFAEGAPITGFKDVGLPQMRKLDSTASETLTSVKVKISDVYFLIALAKGEQDSARNLDLIETRAWFDFPLLLNDNRIAKIVFQKSPEGEAMLAKAFKAWN